MKSAFNPQAHNIYRHKCLGMEAALCTWSWEFVSRTRSYDFLIKDGVIMTPDWSFVFIHSNALLRSIPLRIRRYQHCYHGRGTWVVICHDMTDDRTWYNTCLSHAWLHLARAWSERFHSDNVYEPTFQFCFLLGHVLLLMPPGSGPIPRVIFLFYPTGLQGGCLWRT